MDRLRRFVLLLGLCGAWFPSTGVDAADLPLERIQLPPGFSIALWARVDNPREMTLGRADGSGGTLFVGSSRAGKVHAVRFDGALQVKDVTTVASGLQIPMGVAYQDGSLYVSAVSRILRFDDIERHLDRPPAPVVVTDKRRPRPTMAASSWPSGRMASCMCRPVHPATSASPIRGATRRSRA